MFDYLLYEFLNINFNKFNDIEIINEFKDEAKSAKNDNREEYKELIKSLMRGR